LFQIFIEIFKLRAQIVCKPLAERVNPEAIVFGAHMAGVVPVDEEGRSEKNNNVA